MCIVMGPGQKIVTRVGSGQPFLLYFGLRKLPLKIPNFSIFSLRIKKIASGQVKKYPEQSWVGLLFTADQRYPRFGSGQGPSLVCDNDPIFLCMVQ